jgi:ankyrin repeat protein
MYAKKSRNYLKHMCPENRVSRMPPAIGGGFIMHTLAIIRVGATLLTLLALFCSAVFASQGEALMEAALKGNLKHVQDLLDKGVDVNAKDKDGKTPLMAAAVRGQLEVVKLLLEKGADANAKMQGGGTALTCAACEGQREVAQVLRGLVVELTLVDATCLGDLKAVERLITAGSDVNG